jgi:hypothetical protein
VIQVRRCFDELIAFNEGDIYFKNTNMIVYFIPKENGISLLENAFFLFFLD